SLVPLASLSSYSYRQLRDLHSFPTRRSSDLSGPMKKVRSLTTTVWPNPSSYSGSVSPEPGTVHSLGTRYTAAMAAAPTSSTATRSEEHTSELQSRENLVCRLLLEKKKNTTDK